MPINYKMCYSDAKGSKNRLMIDYVDADTGEAQPQIEFQISNILLNAKLIRHSKTIPGAEEPESMVDVVNQYLKTIPESSQREIYRGMSTIDDLVYLPKADDLIRALQSFSYKMLSLPGMTLCANPERDDNHMSRWVEQNAEIPSTVFRRMEDAPANYVRQSTYLINDYLKLVELNLFVKMIFPLIVTATPRLSDIYGRKYIIKLLECVCIPEIKALPAYQKMYDFVELFAQQNYDIEGTKNAIPAMEKLLFEASISSSEVVDFLMAEIITRRVVSCRTLKDVESSHIVVRMYSRLSSIKDGKSAYTDKNIAANHGDDPHKSVIDEFRVKDRMSVDTQIQLTHIVNPEYLALHVGVDETKLTKMYNSVKRGGFPNIDVLQLEVIRMSLGAHITPNTLHLLSRDKIVLLALTAHLHLIEKHPFLAALMLSERVEGPHGLIQKNMDKVRSKSLLEKYPFDLVVKLKVGDRRVSKRFRVTELIKRTVENYRTHYSSFARKSFIATSIIPMFNENGGLIPIANLADQLGELTSEL